MKHIRVNPQVTLATFATIVATTATALGVLTQVGVIHPAGLGSAKSTPSEQSLAVARRPPSPRGGVNTSTRSATAAIATGNAAIAGGQASVAPTMPAPPPTIAATASPAAQAQTSPTPGVTSAALPPSATATETPVPIQTIHELGADTLAGALTNLNQSLARRSPNLNIQAEFGESAAMVEQVTELGRRADVVAVTDAGPIRSQMAGTSGGPQKADWYVGFATNAIVIAYTAKSKGAGELTKDGWYNTLSEPGVRVGRVDPDSASLGYQTLLLLTLSEQHYHQPGLAAKVLANTPLANTQKSVSALIASLQEGATDYAVVYRSDAVQQHLTFLDLPSEINLSDVSKAATYQTASVQTKHGTETGAPLVAAVTVPTNAEDTAAGTAYVQALLGPDGQQALTESGFLVTQPAIAVGDGTLPAALKGMTVPWPTS